MSDEREQRQPTPEEAEQIRRAGIDMAEKVLTQWVALICRGLDSDQAAHYVSGLELGLHMALADERTAMLAMLMIDIGVHNGETETHIQAHKAGELLRALSADQLEVVGDILKVVNRLDIVLPDVPGAERNN